jgi:G3E family GTPase
MFEEWLELRNGCLCCSVKDNGVKAIETLMNKRGKFDYIMLETTGLADPGPVASIFWLDEELGSDIYLDGIVTVVDAKYGLNQLMDSSLIAPEVPEYGAMQMNTAVKQIALADVVLLNKIDMVEAAQVNEIFKAVKAINSSANLIQTQHSKIDLAHVLDLHAYDGEFTLPTKLPASGENALTPHIDTDIGTVTLSYNKVTTVERLEHLLQNLLWDGTYNPLKILRLKASVNIVDCKSEKVRTVVVQGVNDTYDLFDKTEASQNESVFVIIAKSIDTVVLQNALNSTLSGTVID